MLALEDAVEALEWQYKGEGASNVVLDYHGSHPTLRGKVLRIRKLRSVPAAAEKLLSRKEAELWSHWPTLIKATSEEELLHAFVRDVMRPLLGEEFVDPGTPVSVSREFLMAVSRNIREKRPESRVKAADLDFTSQSVLLVPDHTKFPRVEGDESPTLAVEIKPKWGYLPTSQFIEPSNRMKTQVSRFAMHQRLKYSEGKVKSLSSYCPLDLFSGTRDGIQRALDALFKTPQNNLRLFLNGAKVYTEDGRPDSDSLELQLGAFSDAPQGQRFAALRSLLTELVYKSDILEKVVHAQKEDSLDIEGMIHIYHSYLQEDCGECSALKFSNSCVSEPLNKVEVERQSAILRLHAMPIKEQREFLCKFLTATTAKDCSLILTLRPILDDGGGNIVVCPATGRKYMYKLSLLDLDMKRLDKIPYYFLLDQGIVKFYTQQSGGVLPHGP